MVTGGQIAADAERYIGLGYVYAGDASSPGVWDCSSFVSYVLGHDLGLELPGNGRFGEPGYPPTSHGPVVVDYANWNGAQTINFGQERPGDLAVFEGVGASGHIGIVVGSNLMVSALDTAQGTCKTPIVGYGPSGAPLFYRRILGVPAGPGIPGRPGGGGGVTAPMILAFVVIAGMIGAAFIGAALLGTGIVAGGGYFAYKVVT